MTSLSFFVFCLVVLVVVLYFSKSIRDEGFYGMSPGTLDQLQSTSLPETREADPTSRDVEEQIHQNLVKRDIANMTEVPSAEDEMGGPYAAL